MMSFPVGVHDDQVDALGLVGQLLDRMYSGKPMPQAEPVRIPPAGSVIAPPVEVQHRSDRIRV